MLISIKIPIQAHRGTGVGFYEKKRIKLWQGAETIEQ